MEEFIEEPVYVEVQSRIAELPTTAAARIEYDPESNSVFVRIDYDDSVHWAELNIPWKTLIKLKKTTEEEVAQEIMEEMIGEEGEEMDESE